MKVRQNLITALATGSLLLSVLTPMAFADTTVQETGNGSASTNNATFTSSNTSSLVQNNNANVTNNVTSHVNTGGNTTNDNTGGNVTVDTGSAYSAANVTTKANANVADMTGSANTGSTSVKLSGNGSFSQNGANVNSTNGSQLFQTNTGTVNNSVSSHANTGNNSTNRNTGGSVLVLTGNAGSDTSVNTALNANMAHLNNNSTGGGDNNVTVSGNGSASNNSVSLLQNNAATVVQNNLANVLNHIHSRANTGNNTTNDNTGGNVTVDTGNAMSSADVMTMANFNGAEMANGAFTTGTNVKIAGNGSFSNNSVWAALNNGQSAFQTGNAYVTNDVMTHHNTGNNYANRNTGAVYGDPLNMITGYSGNQTNVQTSTNTNTYGASGWQLPGGTNLNFTFDLQGLLAGMPF